jgi:6,7-dimethyl-8-ribityllumazine synthase
MMDYVEGDLDGKGCRIGIVVSRFNEFVTNRLLAGAEMMLQQLGTPDKQIQVVKVPGAFEIPLVAKTLAQSGRFDAVVCLGAVIRGETPHFEYISGEVGRGIGQTALTSGIPVVFGVLTTDTVNQALDRSGPPECNKGADAARTAVEMVNLLKRLNQENSRQLGFLKKADS